MKLKTAILAAMALIAGAHAHMTAQTSVSHTTAYNYSGLSIGTRSLSGTTYVTVDYAGHYNQGTPGTPSLPLDYVRFSVPYNAYGFSVTAVPADTIDMAVSYPVFPCQQYPNGSPATLPDPVAYGSTYPEHLAWVVDNGFLAGENQIVTVAVMPVSYTPDGSGGSGYLHKHSSISLQLSYSIDPDVSVMYRHDAALRQKAYSRVQGIVVNPEDVAGFSFRGGMTLMNPNGYQDKDTIGIPYPYLIVTTPELKHSLRRIAALKRQQGSNVKVVTVSEALNSPYAQPGDVFDEQQDPIIDDPGKLRQYLRYHFNHKGTENVLLAGSDVPNRGGNDMYFAGLYGDWISRYDYYAELNVGRLLGDQASRFDNYTDKLLRYVLNPGRGDRNYLSRGLFSETGAFNQFYAYAMESLLPDMTIVNEDPDLNFPTGCDLLDSVNVNHYGFWGSYNDGTPSYLLASSEGSLGCHYLWATDTAKVAPGYINDSETGNGLNRMLNKDYPMIFYSAVGCTMPYYTKQGYDVDMNVGESFTMGKDYGGPAYIGLTDNVNSIESLFFTTDLMDNISSNTQSLGEAFYDAKRSITMDPNSYGSEFLKHFNYLGDPTIDMWVDTPQLFSAPTVTRTSSSITVSGIPASSTVAYFSNDTTAGCVTASSSTVTLTDVSPNSTVMVSKRGYLPYIAPLLIQDTEIEDSQYVIASSVAAGNSVDNNRTAGDVVVKDGTEYEIEASGEVRLEGGFSVEKGAYFSVMPSSF